MRHKESPAHVSWRHMFVRCYGKKHRGFALYGGRGIVVCDSWHRYENFLADMGERPPGTSIDRIDSNGNYEPGNCRWATSVQQARNTSRNRWIEWRGTTKTIAEWSSILNINYESLTWRLKSGWSVEDAFTRPVLVRSAISTQRT